MDQKAFDGRVSHPWLSCVRCLFGSTARNGPASGKVRLRRRVRGSGYGHQQALTADQTIYLFVKNSSPKTGALMSEIYETLKDEDGSPAGRRRRFGAARGRSRFWETRGRETTLAQIWNVGKSMQKCGGSTAGAERLTLLQSFL